MAPWWPLLVAALLLSPERICYVWIARYPQAFRRVCRTPAVAWIGDPIVVVAVLFGVFKIVQFLVFLWWLYLHAPGGIWPPIPAPAVLATAGVLAVVGQILNFGVFYRLGAIGVFFGDRLGHVVPWRRDFPFSWVAHPQYVGTVLTIWARVPDRPVPEFGLVPAAAGGDGLLRGGRASRVRPPAHEMDVLGEGSRAPADRAGRPARP